jgi:hypothetical protein
VHLYNCKHKTHVSFPIILQIRPHIPHAPPAAHSDFDPFATQQPVAPVAASDVDPFAEPIPVVKSTPTPFDDLLAVSVPITAAPVSAVAAAPTAAPSGAMTDADFDSFFNELDKK